MKIVKIVLVFAVISIFALAGTAADPAEGYWKSIDDDTGEVTAFWHIYVEGGKLFGEIVKIADKPDSTLAEDVEPSYPDFPVRGDLRRRRVINTPWLYNLTRRSEGHWRNGHIIDPEDGRRYRCEVIFHPADGRNYEVDTLEMKGRVLFFSRSQFWERSSREEVEEFEIRL